MTTVTDAKTVKHTYTSNNTKKNNIIFLFTEKARKRQQLANWFRFVMRRPFHGAGATVQLLLLQY